MTPEFLHSQKLIIEEVLARLTGRVKDSWTEHHSDPADISAAAAAAQDALAVATVMSTTTQDIHAALDKINRGVYGICEATGAEIDAERLVAIPWVRFSIAAQLDLERRAKAKGLSACALFDSESGSASENADSDAEDEKEAQD